MTRALLTTVALTAAAACSPAQLDHWAASLGVEGVDPHDPAALTLAAEAWCANGGALVAHVGADTVATMPPDPLPACTVGDVIDRAAAEFGVDRALLDSITWCESRHDPRAVNRSSGALGLGQHLPRYFPARAAAVGYPADVDPLDPVVNARVTAWLLAEQGTAPWRASRGCWS